MKNAKNRQMRLMTVEEVQAYLKKNQTIILPYALCEQHGYHLPLSTDIHLSELIGKLLAENLGCIMAPALTYCFSGGMLPGTINVKPNHFSAVVTDIMESLTVQGFRKIVIVDGNAKPWTDENGIMYMGVIPFLLEEAGSII